jgi:4-oxalocrotonate tautomerase
MPFVHVRVLDRITPEQKRQVVQDITRSLQERLGKAPERTHVVIEEVPPENWAQGGALKSDTPPA